VVRSEEVACLGVIIGLSQRWGQNSPLKRNGYFKRCPHLLSAGTTVAPTVITRGRVDALHGRCSHVGETVGHPGGAAGRGRNVIDRPAACCGVTAVIVVAFSTRTLVAAVPPDPPSPPSGNLHRRGAGLHLRGRVDVRHIGTRSATGHCDTMTSCGRCAEG
jgi:hypothetical protein